MALLLNQSWTPSRKRQYSVYYLYSQPYTTEEFPLTGVRLCNQQLYHPTSGKALSLAPGLVPSMASFEGLPHAHSPVTQGFNELHLQSTFCVITKGPHAIYELSYAIYGGCIPVLLSDSTHFPFADILDYTRFSVRVRETDLNSLADTLQRLLAPPPPPPSSSPAMIVVDELAALQENLLMARSAFLYPTSSTDEDTHGPFYHLMHSLALRLSSRFPMREQEV